MPLTGTSTQSSSTWTGELLYTLSRPITVSLKTMGENKKITFFALVTISMVITAVLCIALCPEAKSIRDRIKQAYDAPIYKTIASIAVVVLLYAAIAYKLHKDELKERNIYNPQVPKNNIEKQQVPENEPKKVTEWRVINNNFFTGLQGEAHIHLDVNIPPGCQTKWPKHLFHALPKGNYFMFPLGMGRLTQKINQKNYLQFCKECEDQGRGSKIIVLAYEDGGSIKKAEDLSGCTSLPIFSQHPPCYVAMFILNNEKENTDAIHQWNMKEVAKISTALEE